MPLIAVTGQLCAGKHTVADWLVQQKGFKRIKLRKSCSQDPLASPTKKKSGILHNRHEQFTSIDDLVNYATKNWREKLVTTDINRKEECDVLIKRPFFLLISVDAPLMIRWVRYTARCLRLEEAAPSLVSFVQMSDTEFFGDHSLMAHGTAHGNGPVCNRASLRIVNTQSTLQEFHEHLEELDLVNSGRIRPSWDAYFMQLASLASLRSNCMKRRVGCVLVRNKRVISTGYNGTPRGLTNCNEGGCGRCNSASAGGVGLGTCLCLHAEENALLESGRDRVGDEATLYCNTCPCLTCSVKIAQVGVKEVVYNQAYSMDDQSAEILKEAGVLLRQFSPPYED